MIRVARFDRVLSLAFVGVTTACLLLSSLSDDAVAQKRSESRPKRATTVAALIDFDRTAIGGLLEAELLNEQGLTWVERTEIERLLDERKLQLLFSPGGVSERARISRLLKADLLILLRAGKTNDQETVEIAVAEVSRGVRLVSRTVPLSSDADADLKFLLSIARQGIAKQRQEIAAIYAVPPFLSRDLLYEHHDLRRTYAKFIEQQLLEQPQLLVVEFAEAEALQRERTLSTDDEKIRRLLPHYVLGEYRNEGEEADRRVTLTLTHKHGDEQLARVKKTVSPDAAGKVLRDTVAAIVEQQTGQPAAAPDPKREAAQLLARAKEYLTLGDYEDAAALAEASLLMDAEQTEPHVVAIRALTPLVNANWWYGQENLDEAKYAMASYLRGVDHLVAFHHLGGDPYEYLEGGRTNFEVRFLHATNGFAEHPKTSNEMRLLLADVRQRHRHAMMALLELHIKSDPGYAGGFFTRAMAGVSDAEHDRAKLVTILKYQDAPHAAEVVKAFMASGYTLDWLDKPRNRRLLAELDAKGNETVKQAVAELRVARDTFIAARKKEEEKSKSPLPEKVVSGDGSQFKLEPIELTWTSNDGTSGPIDSLANWMATDDGWDIAWTGSSLYLTREPGPWRRVWHAGSPAQVVSDFNRLTKSSVCYDGRYVWLAITYYPEDDLLFVIDPETGERHEVTKGHGLPQPGAEIKKRLRQQLSLAPLGPGRVVVIGGFDRSWIAEATFNEQEGARVAVFHEALTVPDRINREQWCDASVRFPASFAAKLTDDATGDSRVLAFRYTSDETEHIDVAEHPLVIDASSKSVTPFPQALLPGENFSSQDGSLYFVRFAPPQFEQMAILRIRLPGPVVETVMPIEKSGYVIADGGHIHVVGKEWCTADVDTQTLAARGRVPWIYHSPYVYTPPDQFEKLEGDKKQLQFLARSNHYGVVACYVDARRKYTIARVTFSEPASE